MISYVHITEVSDGEVIMLLSLHHMSFILYWFSHFRLRCFQADTSAAAAPYMLDLFFKGYWSATQVRTHNYCAFSCTHLKAYISYF